MDMQHRLNLTVISLFSAFLVACDWVDSTGTQGAIPQTEIFLDDAPIGGAIVIQEKTSARITASRNLSGDENQTYAWSDAPLESGKLDTCTAQDGFRLNLAANDLISACTDPGDCELSFTPIESNDPSLATFELTVPELKTSVGLRYELTISNSDSGHSVREFDFCFISVNEAPDAVDDTFVIREGVREVITTQQLHLLSNDSDDDDLSNQPIRVLTEPVVRPASAAFFVLSQDGSFTYESSLTDLRSDQFDSFEYGVTDGLFISTARATLRIVASNQAPEQTNVLPVINATVGTEFEVDLTPYFVDPEQGNLSYRFSESTPLPSSGTYELSTAGLLSGLAAQADAGDYQLLLIVSDGGHETEAEIQLSIEPLVIPPDNASPVFIEDSVFSQTIFLGRSIRPIQAAFVDADGDSLTYAMDGDSELPEGVTLDQLTGIISGEPEARIWVRDLRVRASDPFGASAVSDPFFIRVR